MTKLPLFPLNTVLFPGMPLSLHIFEERYKLMISRCVAERQPFGVVLLEHGSAEYRPGQSIVPYSVGCTAHITQVQPVNGGRMNIVAIGQDRFAIQDFDHSAPYLIGEVELLPFYKGAIEQLRPRARRLQPWIARYLKLIDQAENLEIDIRQLPRDPITLGYLGAALLKTEMWRKQALLVLEDAGELLDQVRALYRREVTLYEMLTRGETPETNSIFSIN